MNAYPRSLRTNARRLAAGLLGLAAATASAFYPAAAAQERVKPYLVQVTAAAFSPDNRYVLVGYNGGGKLLTVWEVATGKELRSLPGHTDYVRQVAFVAGAKRALSSSRDGRLLLHDVDSGKLLKALQPYTEGVDLAVSADGKLAVTAGLDGGKGEVAKLWDPDGLRLLRSFAAPGTVGVPLALSPDHRWLLSASPPQLWDVASGKVVRSLQLKPVSWGGVAAFSPDSRLALVSRFEDGSNSRLVARIGIWEVGTGKVTRLLEGPGAFPAEFTAAGKQVVGVYYKEQKQWVSFWDTATGKVMRTVRCTPPEGSLHKVVLSKDGRLALVATGGVFEGPFGQKQPEESVLRLTVWDLHAGRLLVQWTRPPADR
jgi:WD40 repeat protein